MTDEKCVNCGKIHEDHHSDADYCWHWCSAKVSDVRTWTPPAPQAVLFEASAIRTGYEL